MSVNTHSQNTATQPSFIKTYEFCDKIPVISTATNLYVLCQKYVLFAETIITKNKQDISSKLIKNDIQYKYIKNKSIFKCVVLLIPIIGNIAVILYDYSQKLTKEQTIAVVKKDGEKLSELDEKFKEDEQIVLAALEQNPKAIVYASAKLKANKEFMLKALKDKGFLTEIIIKSASAELKNDKDFIFETLKDKTEVTIPIIMEFVNPELKNDKDFMLSLISHENSSMILSYSSDTLKSNKEFVLEAIKITHGDCVSIASVELRNDVEVMLPAMQMYAFKTLQVIGEKLKNNKEIFLIALKGTVNALHFAGDDLKNDKEFMISAIKETY